MKTEKRYMYHRILNRISKRYGSLRKRYDDHTAMLYGAYPEFFKGHIETVLYRAAKREARMKYKPKTRREL